MPHLRTKCLRSFLYCSLDYTPLISCFAFCVMLLSSEVIIVYVKVISYILLGYVVLNGYLKALREGDLIVKRQFVLNG